MSYDALVSQKRRRIFSYSKLQVAFNRLLRAFCFLQSCRSPLTGFAALFLNLLSLASTDKSDGLASVRKCVLLRHANPLTSNDIILMVEVAIDTVVHSTIDHFSAEAQGKVRHLEQRQCTVCKGSAFRRVLPEVVNTLRDNKTDPIEQL